MQTAHERTLADDLVGLRALAEAPVSSEADIKANLARIYRELFVAQLSRYDVAALLALNWLLEETALELALTATIGKSS